MLRVCWLLLICFLLLQLELLLAWHGVLFPAALFAGFYIGLAFNARRGLVCGMAVAVCVEVMLYRQATCLPLFLPLALHIRVYERYGSRLSLVNQTVSGVVLGAAYAAWTLVTENVHLHHGWSLLSGSTVLRVWVGGTLAGLLLCPLLILTLDAVAGWMAVERFRVQTARVY